MRHALPLLALLLGVGARAGTPDDDPLLGALVQELDRNFAAWQGQPDPPYHLAARLVQQERLSLSARYGALQNDQQEIDRTLVVEARVGSPELDNTHPLRDRAWHWEDSYSEQVPVDGPPEAIQAALWRLSGQAVRDARRAILKVRANRQVRSEELDPSPDFSKEEPVVWVGPQASLELDREAWRKALLDLSRRVDAHPEIERSEVSLDAVAETSWIVDSEGRRIRQPRVWVRVSMFAHATADDGMDVHVYRWKDAHSPGGLPDIETLGQWADGVARDTAALRAAPAAPPYRGPVLLRGRAAGVFVHEVLGHRAEGHRQKNEDEGQTFRDKVGERVLPTGFSIYDDPTLPSYAGLELNGHYRYDQEGIPAQRAVLVEDGVFKGFLLGRSPVQGFSRSNGHGRADEGSRPVARMANTIVEVKSPVPYTKLRARLIEEAKNQGLEYGLIIDEIAGGFTLTGRGFPNAFNVRAGTTWRVYVDGRPDELVRGLDLIGTPLVALSQVVAGGDDPDVFNGFCGAESGMVPNSAVSPSLLLRSLEVQRKEKDSERPPLLPRPGTPLAPAGKES